MSREGASDEDRRRRRDESDRHFSGKRDDMTRYHRSTNEKNGRYTNGSRGDRRDAEYGDRRGRSRSGSRDREYGDRRDRGRDRRTKEASASSLGASSAPKEKLTKMSSGHSAGIQSGSEFGINEKRLKEQKEAEMREYDKEASGMQASTVYRDKEGRQTDMLSQVMREEAIKEGKKAKVEEAQYEWGKGSVQKQNEAEKIAEIAAIAAGPFARTVNDPKLEKMRREAIREGDPMAAYLLKTEQETLPYEHSKASSASDAKSPIPIASKFPKYKGPNIPANRFNNGKGKPLLPGYRWDGIDRGNKFETKILIKMNESKETREDAYKWSVSDM